MDLFEGQWGRKPRPAARVSECGRLPLFALVLGNRQSKCGSLYFLYSLLVVFSSRGGEGSRTLVSPRSPPWSFCWPLPMPVLEEKCGLGGDTRRLSFLALSPNASHCSHPGLPWPKRLVGQGLEDPATGCRQSPYPMTLRSFFPRDSQLSKGVFVVGRW